VDKLCDGDVARGGLFEPKFLAGAYVLLAIDLALEAPSLCPNVPFPFRGPFELTDRPAKYPELMFARLAEPANLLYELPPFCRGTAERVLRKLLPLECPPPPRWNPPPLLLPPP